MKTRIDLNYNNAYKWFCYDNIYVIGNIYYEGKFLNNEKFVEFVNKNYHDFSTILKNVTGFFAIVINKEDKVILVSDVMRTFPLFYCVDNNQVILSDNIDYFKNAAINKDYSNELINLRYVLGDNTIYNDINQLQSNEIVIIEKNFNCSKERYYNFDIVNSKLCDENKLIESIDIAFDNSIKRLIEYANGRALIVPLSGGYDSRQILLALKKQKYDNIICYTYGKKIEGEALISKKLAKELNCKWLFIKYTNKKLQKIYYDKNEYKSVISYIARGFSSPHIQEWYAIDYLYNNNLVPKDAIFVPGFTGDALSGSHLEEKFFDKEIYSDMEIISKIIDYNYIIISDYDKSCERMKKILGVNCDCLNLTEAVNCYNKYDFEERQVKYITNAVRIYEYFGYEWYLPFWDKEYINFWRSVSLKYKFDRNLLKKYFNYKYEDIMIKIPIYKKLANKKTKNIIKKIYNLLILYYSNNMNLYGYYRYYMYCYQVLLKKNTSYDYIFGKDYINFMRRRKNGI